MVVVPVPAASAPTLEDIESADIENALIASSAAAAVVVVDRREDDDDDVDNIHDDDDDQSNGSTAGTAIISESSSSNPSQEDDHDHADHDDNDTDENAVLCCICVSNKGVVSCGRTGSTNTTGNDDEEGSHRLQRQWQQQQSHKFCTLCLSRYSLTAFMRHGDYEATVVSSSSSDNSTRRRRRSECGQLPCPFFKSNECDCVAFSNDTLCEFLNEEALLRWRQADDRINAMKVAAAAAAANGANEQENIAQDYDDDPAIVSSTPSPLEIAQDAVQEALTIARRTLCPACKVPGEKDAACMHITCPECRTCWCYCCGRRRGGNNIQDVDHYDDENDNGDQEYCNRSCDAISPFLQCYPGWSHFAIRDEEEPGEGALHEFHRRRAMYYLRCIYEALPMELWLQLQNDNNATNHLLQNDAAGPARRITWQEVETAQIPVFGYTRPNQVLWLHDGHQLVNVMLEKLSGGGGCGRKSIRVNGENDNKDCHRHPYIAPSAPPQQQDYVPTTGPPQEMCHPTAAAAAALVPLHAELLRRYREMKGCGWIWTIGLIAVCCALSILPEYDFFRFWAGVTTCILVMTFVSHRFVGLVEINLERVQRTGALGGQPFEEVLFLGSQQAHPYLCTQGAFRNWQWPHALTLWGSLFFAALFSGPSVRTEFPGVGVGLWTLHFMVGVITPLLINTVFRPLQLYIVRVVMSILWGWVAFPIGMFMLYRNKSPSSGNDDGYSWGESPSGDGDDDDDDSAADDDGYLGDPSSIESYMGFLLITVGVVGVLTEIYLCLWATTHPHVVLKHGRIILSYVWSFSLAAMAFLFHIGLSGEGIVVAIFLLISGCFCVMDHRK